MSLGQYGPMSGIRRVLATAVVAGALAVPAGASAESLVFVKGGNVWTAHGDGSHAHRITRNGTRRLPYVHPTQADNGTIVALRATDMFRFTRGGRRIGKPRRVSAGLSGPGSLHELAEASEVSPNAKRVLLQKTLLQGKSGNGISGMQILSVSVEYRTAKTGRRVRTVHQPGDYYQSPSWAGNGRALIFAPYNSYAPEVFVDTFGGSTDGLVLRRAQRRARSVRAAADRRRRAEPERRPDRVRARHERPGRLGGRALRGRSRQLVLRGADAVLQLRPARPRPLLGPVMVAGRVEPRVEQPHRGLDRAVEPVERRLRRNSAPRGAGRQGARLERRLGKLVEEAGDGRDAAVDVRLGRRPVRHRDAHVAAACQVVPPIQQVPSRCTASMTRVGALVVAEARPAPGSARPRWRSPRRRSRPAASAKRAGQRAAAVDQLGHAARGPARAARPRPRTRAPGATTPA